MNIFFFFQQIEETSTEVTNRRSKVSFSPKYIDEVVRVCTGLHVFLVLHQNVLSIENRECRNYLSVDTPHLLLSFIRYRAVDCALA